MTEKSDQKNLTIRKKRFIFIDSRCCAGKMKKEFLENGFIGMETSLLL